MEDNITAEKRFQTMKEEAKSALYDYVSHNPFTFIRFICEQYNHITKCGDCPIKEDCSKWDIDGGTPLDWYKCK